MLTLGLSTRSRHTSVVLRVVALGTLLHGIDFAQTPVTADFCSLTNGLVQGPFGGYDVSGSFTIGATPELSNITVNGPGIPYSYTFSGPLNGPGYTEPSELPPTPCILEGCTSIPPGQAGLFVAPQNSNTIAGLEFEDTGEPFVGLGYLSCTAFTYTPLSPSQVKATASGLAHSRVTQTFDGTINLKNIFTEELDGPFQILFTGLPANVTLANATGELAGTPYLTVPAPSGLAPGQSLTVSVQFKNPSNVTINFTPVIYSGGI
jgi:hypothetical protein